MDFISRIGSFFSDLYNDACSHAHNTFAGTPPRDKPVDHFKTEKIGEAHFDELLRSSRLVRTGCYIEMHQIREINTQQLQEAARRRSGTPAPTTLPGH